MDIDEAKNWVWLRGMLGHWEGSCFLSPRLPHSVTRKPSSSLRHLDCSKAVSSPVSADVLMAMIRKWLEENFILRMKQLRVFTGPLRTACWRLVTRCPLNFYNSNSTLSSKPCSLSASTGSWMQTFPWLTFLICLSSRLRSLLANNRRVSFPKNGIRGYRVRKSRGAVIK